MVVGRRAAVVVGISHRTVHHCCNCQLLFFWRIVKVRWNYFIGWNYFFTGWNYFSIPGINFLIPGIIFLIPGIIFYIKISRVIVNYFNTPIFTYFLYLPTSIRDLEGGPTTASGCLQGTYCIVAVVWFLRVPFSNRFGGTTNLVYISS